MGGLVGKVLEIDEKTRLRHDYVRMKIACSDITKVPRTIESTLGLFIKDFHFEREVEVDGSERTLHCGIRVIEGEQAPPSKKYKADNTSDKGFLQNSGEQLSGKYITMGSDKGGGKQQASNITMSASPKMGSSNAAEGKKAVQKQGEDEDDGERFIYLRLLMNLTLIVTWGTELEGLKDLETLGRRVPKPMMVVILSRSGIWRTGHQLLI